MPTALFRTKWMKIPYIKHSKNENTSLQKGSVFLIEKDTIRLLRECDAGVKMGVKSIDEVVEHIHDPDFRELIIDCRNQHVKLDREIDSLLKQYGDDGKEPNPIASGMSWVKTNMKLGMENSDATVADLMTDGCNMGVKSLHKYLNKYRAADEKTKDITKRLINIEEKLVIDIRIYL